MLVGGDCYQTEYYFKTKIENIVEDIPQTDIDPVMMISEQMIKWKGVRENPVKLKLKQATLEDIKEIIRNLSKTTAKGID